MASFEEMREKHRIDSMLTLSFFLFILLIFIFHTQYTNAVQELIKKPENLADVFEKSWLAVLLTLISPFATYFFGVITIAKRDLYYPIDNAIFRRRIKINRYICQKMLNFKIELTDKDKESLKTLLALIDQPKKCRQIMSLFYRYIEKDDIVNPELKSHAFIYWGDYFSSMMFVFWGSLTLLVAIIMMIFGGPITVLQIVIIFIIVVLISLNLREIFIGKTAQKQFEIPETQISEIHRNAAQILLADLRAEGFFLNDE